MRFFGVPPGFGLATAAQLAANCAYGQVDSPARRARSHGIGPTTPSSNIKSDCATVDLPEFSFQLLVAKREHYPRTVRAAAEGAAITSRLKEPTCPDRISPMICGALITK